ncbi:sensor histidine kinase [Bacillus infantis]|uniref:sensor histidine kinase n=1 Tax=Bacillus TaxID=1386 RepID=UPI001CD30B99|nr:MULTISPECIES: sensor histidine kinase [Bacillus]MCA1038320.1 sensor histidine kinase [Bacillus infantis]MDT0163302.1 sensor histidine kinase [Bacillus sp. AG4(2022)]
MKKKLLVFNSSTGISPYIWAILTILPFYFIFQSSSTAEIVAGIILTVIFYLCFRLAFLSRGWTVYIWAVVLIGISSAMTTLFGYVYFSFFIAYFIGNITGKAAFAVLYILHLVGASAAINYQFVLQDPLFLKQIPFIIISWLSVILLPFSIKNRNMRGRLESQLEDANKRISELVKMEERQRIARDLHDTLGQKLSLIGLKSDLAGKLVYKDPEQARSELKDVQQTARTALNEVRKMVSQMRGIRLKEEVVLIEQILDAAGISFVLKQERQLVNVSLFVENILSMCLKEAVNNVVKHSNASEVIVEIMQANDETAVTVRDNGAGIDPDRDIGKGSGLLGIRERAEFVNGTMEVYQDEGTTLIVRVPNVVKIRQKEELQ